jgi:hypothetical protein
MIALLRTFIVTTVFGGLILLGYWRLSTDRQQRAIAELQALNEEMKQRLARRLAMIERLSRSHRLAHVQILDQRLDAETGAVLETDVLFIELDDDGSELDRQQFTIPGDVLYIDAWTVKFGHEQVASGHPLLGRSLVLLRRVYSQELAPENGFLIDTPGAIPPGYAADEVGAFEQKIWEQFWSIATDADAAAAMGVRVAQGEAAYKLVSTGQIYEMTVDAAGGINLAPLHATATARTADAAKLESDG